jgi:hypothetical protein
MVKNRSIAFSILGAGLALKNPPQERGLLKRVSCSGASEGDRRRRDDYQPTLTAGLPVVCRNVSGCAS